MDEFAPRYKLFQNQSAERRLITTYAGVLLQSNAHTHAYTPAHTPRYPQKTRVAHVQQPHTHTHTHSHTVVQQRTTKLCAGADRSEECEQCATQRVWLTFNMQTLHLCARTRSHTLFLSPFRTHSLNTALTARGRGLEVAQVHPFR